MYPTDDTRSIRITPGDFVHPPFIRCPKCGLDTFGILSIIKDRYFRRCKNCFFPTHPERHPETLLPKLGKKLIYLDQFVISKIALSLNPTSPKHGKDPHHELWLHVFQKLDTLAKMQLIVCPQSEFHEYESLPAGAFNDLQTIYEHLSYGVRFKSMDQIQRWHIIESFDRWLAEKPECRSQYVADDFLFGDPSAWTEHLRICVKMRPDAALVDELCKIREETHHGFADIFRRWQSETQKSFHEFVDEETTGMARSFRNVFIADLNRKIQAQQQIVNSGSMSMNLFATLLPSHETLVFADIHRRLLNHGWNNENWLGKALQYFDSKHFRGLPFVVLNSHLWAVVADRAAHAGQRKLPTRGFFNDVKFISSFLPFCDAMFVDRESHGILEVKQTQSILADYNTRIFSLRNSHEFINFLDEIESAASQEHLALLKEVYGEKYLKPYTTILSG